MSYRTSAIDTPGMPPGIPWIIGNEAAERFSFYGMRTILVVFMAQYLHLMDDSVVSAMSETQATANYHKFVKYVYFTPLLGALLADVWLGRFRTIMLLSVVYCLGHAALACMGNFGYSKGWMFVGLALITLGSGGIKPCISANVGDQFGPRNQHLLSRIYNWFYFSINLGSFVSTLLTPWLLEWYGPHWAFGTPGVLMAVATLLFWMGRHQFAHVPPAGRRFFVEFCSREGLVALGKLLPLFLFIAMFWALYDQTGSSWVFQSARMDLSFMGIKWLPSQIQAANPVLILTFIPLFTLFIYPLVGRVITLTPLRKIGSGLFLVAASFAIITLIQVWIDAGRTPSIAWQLLAYLIITAAEILVSIVGIEFAYTQAPKSLKSMIMSFYLLSVWAGNQVTETINEFIQIPSAAALQVAQTADAATLPGFDGVVGTADDFRLLPEADKPPRLLIPGQAAFEAAAAVVEALTLRRDGELPPVGEVDGLGSDLWGNPIHYRIVDAKSFSLISSGPDHTDMTAWDQGLTVKVEHPEGPTEPSWSDRFHPSERWLDARHRELGSKPPAAKETAGITFQRSAFSGGQTKLEGAAYYRFFLWLMLGTAVVYVPFAWFYRPRAYLG